MDRRVEKLCSRVSTLAAGYALRDAFEAPILSARPCTKTTLTPGNFLYKFCNISFAAYRDSGHAPYSLPPFIPFYTQREEVLHTLSLYPPLTIRTSVTQDTPLYALDTLTILGFLTPSDCYLKKLFAFFFVEIILRYTFLKYHIVLLTN